MRFLVFTLVLLLTFTSCKKEKKDTPKLVEETVTKAEEIKYADGFSIRNHENYKEIKITAPWPDSKETYTYILTKDKNKVDIQNKEAIVIQVPIQKVVVMSTTNIPALEYLDIDDRLVGFPNTNYISSKRTRANIDNGKIKDLNNDLEINMELLLELQPELVIGFSVNGNNKTLDKIEKFGIPVVLDGAWTEKHPLGRAEWIKFIAAFFEKETEANTVFKTIEKEYLAAKEIALNVTKKPTVFSGSTYKDVWNIPGGKSFVAKYLEDANTDYLWKDTPNIGSLQLNFENVLAKGKEADLWIGAGSFKNKEQMASQNKQYTFFDAYKNNKIYAYTNKIGETGGLLYFELGSLRPDLILKDIIKIAHPELLNEYEPFFFKALE